MNDFEYYGMTKNEVFSLYQEMKEKAKENPDFHQVARSVYLFWQTGKAHCVCCCKPENLCIFAY